MDLMPYIYSRCKTLGPAIVGQKGEAIGPFYGIAPEKTPFDYMVYTISGGGRIQGNLDGKKTYIARPFVSIDTYCSGMNASDKALSNIEAACKLFDTVTNAPIGQDVIIDFERQGDPTLLPEDTDKDNNRVYHASVGYMVVIHREF